MPRPLRPRPNEQTRQAIALRCQKDYLKTSDIAAEFHVSQRLVQRYRNNLDDYGSIKAPPIGIVGRPNKITKAAEERLLGFVVEGGFQREAGRMPNLEDLLDVLQDEFGIVVDKSTVSRRMKALKVPLRRKGAKGKEKGKGKGKEQGKEGDGEGGGEQDGNATTAGES